jgi:Zn finger protein HypA/HybF involved in hydrogenase expression
MTAMKINRFNLLELDGVTLRCKKCGAGHIVKMDAGHLNVSRCPSCGSAYGALAEEGYYRLREAYNAMKEVSNSVGMEFDIPEME